MKRILFFLIMQTSLFPLMADEGGVTNDEDWTYGNIYVKEPNDKIALEKELMVCDKDSITAIFVFKNTTADTVAVDCAFPMDVKLSYTCGNKRDEDLDRWKYYSFRVLKWLLGPKDTLKPAEVIGEDGAIALNDRVKELVLRHDKELRVMDFGHYCQYMESLLGEDYARFYPLCEIAQDGKPVTLLNVGIESDVSPQEIAMRFHFHHQLTFLPNAYSKVVVRYGIESLKVGSYESDYRYCYDISTGGTWKGNIRSFMVVTRNCSMGSSSSNPVNRHFDYMCCDELEECGIYLKKEYKPEKGDCFFFDYYDAISYDHDQYPAPKYEKLRCVPLKDVESSSWLNPSAVMDGSQFTSCAIVDWRNASLEFTLPQDGFGPFICNGTSGDLVSVEDLYAFEKSFSGSGGEARKWVGVNDVVDDKPFRIDPSIYDYNWPKEISLKRLEEPFDSVPFSLEIFDMRKFPLLCDWGRISAVRDLSYFPAGRYRLSINDCYWGNRTQDTTYVTELWFLPVSRDMSEMMAEDRKSEFPIFQHVFDYVRGKENFRGYIPYGTIVQEGEETLGNVSGRCYVTDLFGNKKFHRTYTNPPEQDEKETNFPLLYVVIGAVATLALIGGFVYWRRKRR